MASDFFNNTVQWKMERNGVQVTFPVFYQDALFLTSLFTASTSKVRKLIPHPDLHPMEIRPGRCLVGISAFEYRQCDISGYNELSISFLVNYKKGSIPLITLAQAARSRVYPAFTWQLPVTTEIARAGGVAFFNLPKYLADINFKKQKETVECSLSVPGAEILHITSRVLPTKQAKPIQDVTYSIMDGSLLFTNLRVNPIEFAQSSTPEDFKLKLNMHHPTCQALHEIELSDQSLFSQYCPRCEMILFPVHNISDR